MTDHILFQAKTSVPSHWHQNFSRRRVQYLLAQSISYPLVTVVAGPRYGKTAVISEFVQTRCLPCVWLSLTKLDRSINRFWRSLSFAVGRLDAEGGQDLKKLGIPDCQEDLAAFIRTMTDFVRRQTRFNRPLLLVLDDFDLVQDGPPAWVMQQLVAAGIKNLTTVIISRQNPGWIAVVGNRGRGCFTITQADLAMTHAEIKDFFRSRGRTLTDAAADRAETFTQGWPDAVVQLEKHMSRGLSFSQAATLIESTTIQALDEDFQTLDPAIKDMLIHISFASIFPLSLMENIGAPSLGKEAVLASCLANSFLTYNQARGEIKIHNLYLTYLRQKGKLYPPERVAAIRTRLASWFEEHGYGGEALAQYAHLQGCLQVGAFPLENLSYLFPAYRKKGLDALQQSLGRNPNGRDALLAAEILYERGRTKDLEVLFTSDTPCASPKAAHLASGWDFLKLKTALLNGNAPLVQRRLDDIAARGGHPLIEGWYYAKLGLLERLPDWLQTGGAPGGPGSELQSLIYAQGLLWQEGTKHLETVLTTIEEEFLQQHCLLGCIHALLLRAALSYRLQNISESTRLFQTAARQARDDHLVAPFLEYSRHLLPLVKKLRRENALEATWLNQLYRRMTQYDRALEKLRRPVGGVDTESGLSYQEGKVLTALLQGLSCQKIAYEQGLSHATVRTITCNIYNKLGVNNRAELVTYALGKRLVP